EVGLAGEAGDHAPQVVADRRDGEIGRERGVDEGGLASDGPLASDEVKLGAGGGAANTGGLEVQGAVHGAVGGVLDVGVVRELADAGQLEAHIGGAEAEVGS